MSEPRSSSELTARFERLLEQYATLLRTAIARHCPSALGLQTSDIEQEARLRLWRAVEREKEFDDPASYIYRIAVTTTIDAVRRVLARREEQFGEDDALPGSEMHMTADPNTAPDALAERRELMNAIRSALGSIARDRRRAVELHLQGLTLGEISHLLGWTEGRTRNLVYRGLDDLRQTLRREGIEYE
jgi:RNA polymerase sigma factor (sigma-70 family)